jgi:hypothetical protein
MLRNKTERKINKKELESRNQINKDQNFYKKINAIK